RSTQLRIVNHPHVIGRTGIVIDEPRIRTLRGQCLLLPYCPGFVKATPLPERLGGDCVGVAFFRNCCLFQRQTMPQATNGPAPPACVVLRLDHAPQSSIDGMVQLVPRKWPLCSPPLAVQRNSVLVELPAHRFCYRALITNLS